MPEWRPPSKELTKRLADSHQWWLSEGTEGAPLVAHHEDLSGVDLGEQSLVEAQLQGANLRGARLDSALLMRARLDGADLSGAYLFQADLSRASAIDASLDDVEGPRARLQRADLSRASLVRADLAGAYAAGLEANRADLTAAILRDADLTGATLLGSAMHDLDLFHARTERLVVSQGALAQARGVDDTIGDWIEVSVAVQPTRSVRDFDSRIEADLFRRLEHMPAVRRAHTGLREVDFVVELENGSMLAIEVKGDRTLMLPQVDADVVATPNTDRPEALPPIVSFSRLEGWLESFRPSGTSVRAATQLIERQATRLRPYELLLQQAAEDPSTVSRVAAFLDTRQDVMLTGADRPIVSLLPANLDGVMLDRAVRWADRNRKRIADVLDLARSDVSRMEPRRADVVARLGVELEDELDAVVRDTLG